MSFLQEKIQKIHTFIKDFLERCCHADTTSTLSGEKDEEHLNDLPEPEIEPLQEKSKIIK